MTRRRRRRWRTGGLKTAVEIGLGASLLAAAFGWFVADWNEVLTTNVALATFLLVTASWLLWPLFRRLKLPRLSVRPWSWARRPGRRRVRRATRPAQPRPARTSGLSPRDFERLCADVCRAWGYDARVGSGSGDGGVDVELWHDGSYGIGQCKLYAGSVPIAMVRDFYGTMMHRGATIGFFFTTGRFPASAEEFAAGKNIHLIDGPYLEAILLEQQRHDWLSRLGS
ncbi:MAG TPA: restriction endonuclease [Ardenticatenaceae bacterium]|nr:restriction endonuclease [Ardenticatenaceae bacterium]